WPERLTARRLLFNAYLPALLRTLRYDLVVGFDIDGFLWSGRPPAARGGTPYVVSIKGVLAEEARQERGEARRLLWSLSHLERHNARGADAVLATSAYCRDAIVRHYGVPPQRVRLVPEGIDLERWRRIGHQEPHETDGATILCVARQYPRKHVADLLRAMPLVRRAVPQAQALIVGDGPEHDNLLRLHARLGLGEAARLLGAIPDDDALARLYRHADVFCLPSVQEGFGIVFLEAMASGLPIVGTTAAAIPEVVPHGRAGTLVPPGDVAALAGALVELLQRPELRASYAAYGQEHVERYDWGRVAESFLEAVAPLLGQARLAA
ncbi:MAG TPA: glycosyltransferase family 4 protein, partial [Roseiflexaceae bacterium]|nr:glycosyltransferase family 4 protein [Roseiflexaceae bacterium]